MEQQDLHCGAEATPITVNILSSRLPIHDLSLVAQSFREGNCRKLFCSGRISDGFVYVTGGRCRYDFQDHTHFVASQGDMIYLAKDSVYSMTSFPEKFSYYYCNFEFLDPSMSPRQSLLVPLKNPGEGEAIFSSLLRLWSRYPENTFPECMQALYSLYGQMLRSGSLDKYYAANIRNTILRIKENMDHHPEDTGLTAEAMAREAGVSEVYFRRVFKATVGQSPNQYLISARLNRAMTLIVNAPELSLEQIAELSGFSTGSYLSASFKQHFNMTIREFKRR